MQNALPIAPGGGALVFTYGTLRPGLANHSEMQGATHLGTGLTFGKYALYADAELPYLARTPASSRITGDIFLVNPAHLARLDAFEGHPHWYRRELVVVETEKGTEQCWIYFCLAPQGSIVQSGDYALHLASQR